MCHGVIDSALRRKRNTEIVVSVGEIRPEGQGKLVLSYGVADTPRHMMPEGIVKNSLDIPQRRIGLPAMPGPRERG
jgi:hypothetical protein